MDDHDRQLLVFVQKPVRFIPKPYALWARFLKISEEEVLLRLHQLQEKKILSKIRAVFNLMQLGYRSALFAMRFSSGQIEEAAEKIRSFPGVRELCRRDYGFALWGIVSLPLGADMTDYFERLRCEARAQQVEWMPAVKTFKMGPSQLKGDPDFEPLFLKDVDRRLMRALQNELPLTHEPYQALAEEVGLTEFEVLEKLLGWQSSGVLKTLSADWIPQEEIFLKEVLVAWQIPTEKLEKLAKEVIRFKAVRRCVQRREGEGFPFSLYATIEAPTLRKCHESIRLIESRIGKWPSIQCLNLKNYECLYKDDLFTGFDEQSRLREAQSV